MGGNNTSKFSKFYVGNFKIITTGVIDNVQKGCIYRSLLLCNNFCISAIEAWVIVCVLFVFGALIEYAGTKIYSPNFNLDL